MASGTLREAMSSVMEDKLLVESARSKNMRKFGRRVLEKSVEGEREIQAFDDFAGKLSSKLQLVFSKVSKLKTLPSKRSKCWSLFHELRLQILPELWLDFLRTLQLVKEAEEVDTFFTESVNQDVFQQMSLAYFAEICKSESSMSHAVSVSLTTDQLNAMRYACGYVPHMLLKKYRSRTGAKAERYVHILKKMAIESETDSTLYLYTKVWQQKINRGGLFELNDQHFELFVAIEKVVQVLLPKHTTKTEPDIKEVPDPVLKDEDVQFFWAMLSQDIDSEEEADELLEEMVQKWITVRGFSIAASWMEEYKNTSETTTVKSTSLRKHLS